MTAQGNHVLPAVPPLPASPGPSAATCASLPTEGIAETFQPELPWISIASLMEVISAASTMAAYGDATSTAFGQTMLQLVIRSALYQYLSNGEIGVTTSGGGSINAGLVIGIIAAVVVVAVVIVIVAVVVNKKKKAKQA